MREKRQLVIIFEGGNKPNYGATIDYIDRYYELFEKKFEGTKISLGGGGVLKKIEPYLERNAGKDVIIICDVDKHFGKKGQIGEFLNKEGVCVCLSNRQFELWLELHEEDFQIPNEVKQYSPKRKSELEKSIKKITKEDVNRATKRAKEHFDKLNGDYSKPFTTCYKLIEKIKSCIL